MSLTDGSRKDRKTEKSGEWKDDRAINRWSILDVTGLKEKFEIAMNITKAKFPNAVLCYVASRIYGGYTTTLLGREVKDSC